MVSTPPKVDALGTAQRSGQPVAKEDHRGEHRPAWPTREAAGCRPPPPPGIGPHLNDVSPRVERPRGIAIAAVRGGGGGVAAHQGEAQLTKEAM
jgi:hypothetical protein